MRLRLRHEDRLLAWALAGGAPALALALLLLWRAPFALPLRVAGASVVVRGYWTGEDVASGTTASEESRTVPVRPAKVD